MQPVIASDPSDAIISITSQQWRLRPHDEREVLLLTQRLGIPDIVARILSARGIGIDEAESFLKPTLREFLPDPFHLKGMAEAVLRVAQEVTGYSLLVTGKENASSPTNNQQPVTSNHSIAIFGDYDVDGATSSALLVRYFRALGMEPLVHIPDRMKEGYGPNAPALLSLKERGAKLIITVDCGTLAFEPLMAAKEAGLDVIVLDHHKGEPEMPECFALVNPNRFDETSGHTQLAAVGVTFLFLVALNKRLKEQGFFDPPHPNLPPQGGKGQQRLLPQQGGKGYAALSSPSPLTGEGRGGGEIKQPNLLDLLEIVALGTICDVVPLTGVNRALVSQGLKVMAQRGNVGINALMDAAKLDERPSTYHAGFIIGPRINAGGRVGESDLGVKILTTDDAFEAAALAQRLSAYNEERKAIEAGVLEEALAMAYALPQDDAAIVVASERWHAGVIGIVAGRLKDVFHKPTAVIALAGGIGKASARSISGIDIGAAVIAAHQSGVLLGGGGHAMAAGFSIAENSVSALREFFNHWMKPYLASMQGARKLSMDAALTVKSITPDLVRAVEMLGPFGAGNATPRIMLTGVKVVRADVVGTEHVRVILADTVGSGSLKAMAFRAANNGIGEVLLNQKGAPLHVAGHVRLNFWQGNETAEFTIDDVALA